jgi:hypothetical protein
MKAAKSVMHNVAEEEPETVTISTAGEFVGCMV